MRTTTFALLLTCFAGCAYGGGSDPSLTGGELVGGEHHYGPSGRPDGRWDTPQGPSSLSRESTLCDRYDTSGCHGGALDRDVLTYLEANGRVGEFQGVGGKKIAFAYFPDPHPVASLVIVQGRAEAYLKYAELIYDLRDLGFDLYLIDHRGQGRSDRLLSDRMKGYVDSFDDYATDLSTFIELAVPRDRPAFALAHSMGGAILALYLLDHPHRFDAVVFSSPMWEINFTDSGFPSTVAEILAYAAWDSWYAIGQGPYNPTEPFAGNKVTNSEPRFELARRMFSEDQSARLGGVTFGWLEAAFDADDEIADRAGELSTPMLVMSAGNDHLVVSARHTDVCNRAQDCTHVEYPGAQHELLNEHDSVRSDAIGRTLGFFRERMP